MSPGRLRDSVDIDTAHGSQDAAHALKKSVRQQGTQGASTSDCTITWLSGSPGPIFEELGEKELHATVTDVDPKDAVTPDNWVPRHRDLIRLTGRHPFNCEPPLPHLMASGFITPTSLHYVRNHGAVPRLSWETHQLTVGGLVEKPTTFSMDDLVKKFEAHTICVTLACAGNRRKEQNMVTKTKGFNWGPSATSTGAWTGVRLVDLLRACKVRSYKQGARFVHTNGVKGELPQGDGTYGTSIHYGMAMDPASDVLVAYMYNGRPLAPDHGFPVRIIIPGCIGGRMVKWLRTIEVLDTHSTNHYHRHDNKVLPAGITMEIANAEGWWQKEDFVINELNVQSVITSPGHDEIIPLTQEKYTVKGYAYSGGGRKVIRAEVSLDAGQSWLISNIIRFEEPTEYNKHWCWVFFEVDVPIVDLLRATEMRSRAVDASNNLQPDNLTWNLMGMLNNPHYRIKTKPESSQQLGLGIHCEHPTKSGGEAGGWMEREMLANAPPAAEVVVSSGPDTSRLPTYSPEEIERHDSHESSWFIHDGNVYDATKFLKEHPGGAESILIVAGADATDDFNAIHSARAKGMIKQYIIGRVGKSTGGDGKPEQAPVDKENKEAGAELIALNPKKKISFKLAEKHELSHNVRRLRFALQTPEHRTGLPVGQHMFFYAKDKGETIMRAYTPTSSDDDLGYFDLVIKIYFSNEHPQFPLGGRMTQVMEALKVGDSMEVKGPLGHFIYQGRGSYKHSGKAGTCRQLSMIAGGTGITPMWQVIQAVLKDKEDYTQMKLIFGNQTEDDILLKEELDTLAMDARFSVHHVLSRVKSWSGGSTGRVTVDLIKEHCFPAGDDTLCLLCGPPGMIDAACKPALDKLGYSPEHIVVF